MRAERIDRERLRGVRMFASLRDADLDALAITMRARRLGEGEVLFRQGSPGDSMVVVCEGRLGAHVSSAEGAAVPLAEARVGEVLGEMACIDPSARSATVTALEPALVAELSRDGLQALRQAAPVVYTTILGAVISDVTRRLRDIQQRIDDVQARAPTSAPTSTAPVSARGAFWRFIDRFRGHA